MKRIACGLVLLLVVGAAWPVRVARAAETDAWVPTGEEVRRAVPPGSYARAPTRMRPRERWQFTVAVPVWIPSVSGSFASGGVDVDVDRDLETLFDSFFDVVTDLDFAFVGSFQAQHGPWSFGVEGFGASLGNDIEFKLTDGTVADATITAVIASAWVGRRILTRPTCLFGSRGCFELDAFAGARWSYAKYELTLPRRESDDSGSWVDPIGGLDARLGVGRRWVVRVRGDVGGFGVGADLAWWLVPSLEYRFTNLFSLAFGWALMAGDYSEGTGSDRFAWDLSLSGPQLAVGFRF